MNLIKNRVTKLAVVFVLLAALILSFSLPALASDNTLSEIRTLLETKYVDPVSEDVLNSTTIRDTLDKLGDPWTMYFNAEEYKNFVDSVNMQIYGIGIVLDMVPEGIKVVKALPSSPAEEAGLKSGDVLTSAGGQSLAGKSTETASLIIRGPEGTKVDLIIRRGSESFPLTVTRRKIEVPTVSGELIDNSIGYVDVLSFGSTTSDEFETTVKTLQQKGAVRWIVDLRDDPGGYVDTALSLAGYFIGSQPAMKVIDRTGSTQTYDAVKHSILLDQPVIFLTNNNSASASEILTAAVKDYKKATILGTKTYGKGKMQGMFTLSDGGALKMTIARFYSPQGNTIDKVGVLPEIDIGDLDAKKAAVLLLDQPTTTDSSDTSGYVKIKGNGQDFQLSLTNAEAEENWPVFYQMVTSQMVQNSAVQPIWPIFYPGYFNAGNLSDIPLDKKFNIHSSDPINWSKVNAQTIQLLESTTGQILDVSFEQVSQSDIRVIPKKSLKENTTYWIVIHPDILDRKGPTLKNGAVAVAQTINSQEQGNTLKTQSLKPVEQNIESGYGQALINFGK